MGKPAVHATPFQATQAGGCVIFFKKIKVENFKAKNVISKLLFMVDVKILELT